MTEEDSLNQAVAYLKTLQPGKQPLELFLQLARLMVITTIELVPLRLNSEGKVEVLLVQRPKGDVWDEQWHTPGTVVLVTDKMDAGEDYEQPLSRVLGPGSELGDVAYAGKPKEVRTERRRGVRGDELSVIFYVEITGEPANGRFFPLDGFPENVPPNGVVPHHIEMVRRVAEQFLADKNKG